MRWEVLAAINEIETDYGRNLNVSSAGALGWMQFMPASWEIYGVDGNQDGLKDPYNPVDAIFAAARYLRAAGADQRPARARSSPTTTPTGTSTRSSCARAASAACPPTSSARSPASPRAASRSRPRRPTPRTSRAATSRRAGQAERRLRRRVQRDRRKGIKIFAKRRRAGGRRQRRPDRQDRPQPPARPLRELQDVYGNTYTYARPQAGRRSPTRRPSRRSDRPEGRSRRELALPAARRRARQAPASATTKTEAGGAQGRQVRQGAQAPRRSRGARRTPTAAPAKERLFANPDRPNASAAGGDQQDYDARRSDFGSYLNRVFGLDRADVDMKPLERGARVTAGHRARPHRPRLAPHRAAPAVRDPAGRPRRPADRPEADPRRLEAARVDRDLPRREPQPVRRQGRGRPRRSARSC